MRVSIVVPTFNGAELLSRHLASVRDEAAALPGGAEVIVVDDGSDAGAAAIAEVVRAAGAPVRAVRRERNGGFAAAVNDGVGEARGSCVLVLNDDMHVEPGSLAALLEALAARPDLFAVVPTIANLAEGSIESATALRFHHGVFDVVPPASRAVAPPAAGDLRPAAYPCGGALLCRRTELAALGGLSPLLAPFYWEDVDLGWRARRAGRGVAECGDARVLHEHARTISRLPAARVRRTFERNRLLFTWLHLAGWRGWLSHLAWLPLRWLAAAVRRDPAAAALPLALAALPAVLGERARLRPSLPVAARLLASTRAAGARGTAAEIGYGAGAAGSGQAPPIA